MTTQHRRTDTEEPSDDLPTPCDVAHHIGVIKAALEADEDTLEASWDLIRACDVAAVEPLLIMLVDQNESPAFRSIAAAIQGWLQDSRVVGPLLDIMADTNDAIDVRRSSLWALERFHDVQVIEAFGNVLLDRADDVELRIFAAYALRNTQNAQAIAPLLAAAQDPLPGVRGAVADALGRVGDDSVIGCLITLCGDPAAEVRAEAADALRWLAWHNHKATSAVEPLINMLIDETERTIVRRSAASALGFIGDACAVEPLIGLLSRKGRKFRDDIIDALGELKDTRAVEPLLSMLADNAEDARIVTDVVRALGHVGDMRAADPLVAFFHREGLAFDLQRDALESLKDLGDPRTAELMIPLLKNDDKWVRYWIADKLGEVGNHLAVEPLVETLLHDSDAEVRSAAAKSLIHLPDSHTAQPLMLALKDEDPLVRAYAAEALGALHEDWTFDVLTSTLLDKAEEGYTRSGAAKGLCYSGGEKVVELVLQVVDEEDDFLLYSVAEVLGELGDRSVLPTLRRLYTRKKWDWIADRITDSIALIEEKYPTDPIC